MPSMIDLGFAGAALLAALAVPVAQAQSAHHDHAAHTAATQTPTQRWTTDAPLRAGMRDLREATELLNHYQMGHLDAMDPGAAYGNAKHFAEHLCLQLGIAHGFEVCIARLFAFVGPLLPLDAHFAAGNFLRDGLVGKRIQVLGDGTPLRSYLHAAELAHWLWTLMARGEAGQAYNVGSDEAVSIRELAELTGRICGVGVDVLGTPVPNRAPARYVPDIRKAASLGLAPRWVLETSIRRTLAWHQGREIA